MKKIGIMSMQRINNYGSFLQAYALKKTIEDLGNYEVEFVDYKAGKPLVTSKKLRFSRLRNGIKIIINKEFREKRKEREKLNDLFQSEFIPKLGVTKSQNLSPKLDTLVIGSDEVFNCTQANKSVGYSPDLFGKNNRAKRLISYAGSFGNTTISKLDDFDKKDEVFELIRNFDAISVRDKNSYNIVKHSGFVGDILVSLDPVLIYNYESIIEQYTRVVEEDYVILYGYDYRFKKEEIETIEKFCKRNNKKIICIGGVQNIEGDFIVCDPFECLAYFKYADYIITDTFHGTIFSIIFKKQFSTLIRTSDSVGYGNEEKLTFLLEKMKLENRAMYDIERLHENYNNIIDYTETFDVLTTEKNKTIKYLSENL